MEFLGGIDGALHPLIYGISVFDSLADEVANILCEKNAGEIVDAKHGYLYADKKLSVGVYRETTPEDISEMIEDMKSSGVQIDGNEDISEELKKANHWATIGIGVAGYYKNI